MDKKAKRLIIERVRRTPVVAQVDVAVVGGGPAGLTAAIAAARNGAKTLLIERYGFLGGMFTLEHASYPGSLTAGISFQDTKGNQIVKGIALEIMQKLRQKGGVFGPVDRVVLFDGDFLDAPYAKWGPKIDVEIFKTLAFEMTKEAGVDLMLHSLVVDAVCTNGSLKGVIVQSKSGRQAILAKVIIDASADGDVAAAAGARYEKSPRNQLWRMNVELMLGNVNTEKAARFMKENPNKFAMVIFPADEKVVPEGTQCPILAVVETKRHDIKVMEDRQGLEAKYPFWTIYIGFHKGISDAAGWFNGDPTNVQDLTQAEIVGRERALEALDWLRRNLPGCEDSFIVSTSPLGLRESRRILGEYMITKDDIASGSQFDDSIGLSNMPMDMHISGGGWQYRVLQGPHEIPFRSLLPLGIKNLLVAGRCISCEHIAQSALRKVPVCLVTGQAAGTAAGLAIRKGIRPRNVVIKELQELLVAQGVVIHKHMSA